MRARYRQARRSIALAVLTIAIVACGGGSGGLGSVQNGQGAVSSTCNMISGPSALYWDFSTGVLRTDYPIASTLPPNPVGGSFLHPRISMTFFYPTGWSATAIIDTFTTTAEPATVLQGNLTVLAGVSVVRSDGQALWRYLHTTEASAITAQQRLNEEVQRVINGFGIADQPVELCSLEGPGFVGGFPGTLSATYLQAGGMTIQVVVSAAQVPLIGQSNSLVTVTTVAPIAQYDARALDTFLPIAWQLISRGGEDTECSDMIDNDGDGAVDLNDPQCTGPNDQSESN